MSVWICKCECRCQQRLESSDPLDIVLQMVLSHLIKVLGIKLGSSGRATVFLTDKPSLLIICLFVFEAGSCYVVLAGLALM